MRRRMDRRHGPGGGTARGIRVLQRSVGVDVLQDFRDKATRPSAAGLRPQNYTRLSGTLRHVTDRLMQEPASRRAMLVLSDAVPFDEGYEGHYACADVAKAVQEAEDRGIAVSILGVGEASADGSLDALGALLVRVETIDDLAPAIGDMQAQLAA